MRNRTIRNQVFAECFSIEMIGSLTSGTNMMG